MNKPSVTTGGEADHPEPADYQDANRELRRQRAILQHIIDTVPHSIFWKDRNSVYLGANKTKLRSLGLSSPEQLVGKTDLETRVSKDQAEVYRRCDREVLATGEPLLNREESQRHPDGDRVLLTSKAPLRDEDDEVIGLTGICIDITERKRMEIALERAKAAAEAAASARRDFLSATSHEIRTPLTLILGPLDAILSGKSGPLPEATMAELARVRRNAGRLFSLANDILDFTRIEAGQTQIYPEPVDPQALLASILDDVGWIVDDKRLQIRFAPEPGLGLVSLDRTMFEKVAINLITNALKYTPPDGRVEVTLRRDGVELELTVADTGPGIPADKQDVIFQRFTRLDANLGGKTGRSHGAGFGLAYVRELTTLMGGSVGLQSEVGKGSRFVVRLPVVAGAVPASAPNPLSSLRPLILQKVDASNQRSGRPANEDGTKQTSVLIVDDNPEVRVLMARILGDRHDVQMAENGKQALEQIRRAKPAVVIADVMMPEMDGYQLVTAMKADPNLRQIPVILVTAKSTREEIVAGLDLGADDYLAKPFAPAELHARVRAAERRNAVYEELAAKHRELSSAMRRLNETQADLVQTEKLAAVGTLIAGMSHELGNPVTAILMSAQSLLGRTPRQTEGRTSLEVIERQARRAGRLLKLLLDASRTKPIMTAPVAVEELIARVAELAGIAKLHREGVALKLEPIGPGLPLVDACVEEMEVALLHVIKNGLEAVTPNGQVWVRAHRRDDQKAPGVEILIGDSGIGIAPDVLGQIFDPLFTTKPIGSGMGLGLTLARRIVESHRGWIRVESQVGVGTVVRIWLPAASSAIAPIRNDA